MSETEPLFLRVPPALKLRLQGYARSHGLSDNAAALVLLDRALSDEATAPFDIQVLTTEGTWRKPPGTEWVRILSSDRGEVTVDGSTYPLNGIQSSGWVIVMSFRQPAGGSGRHGA